MATFLQLAQKVARESGTVSGTQPSSVTSQTDRLLKIVNWTADAWTHIQNSKPNWMWMDASWSATLTINTTTYTASALGISSRFGAWVQDNPIKRFYPTTMYDSSIGVSDEGILRQLTYSQWLTRYGRGTQTANKPGHWAIANNNSLVFGPKPDLSTYVVSGRYRKGPQTLSANADEPEMPERFHDAIVWYALGYLVEHDEAVNQVAGFRSRYMQLMHQLERDQLPPESQPHIAAGPLA